MSDLKSLNSCQTPVKSRSSVVTKFGTIQSLRQVVVKGQLQPTAKYCEKSPFIEHKKVPKHQSTRQRRQIDKTISQSSIVSQASNYDELVAQNKDLREQLQSQIQLFEQYLEVSKIQAKKIDKPKKQVSQQQLMLQIQTLQELLRKYNDQETIQTADLLKYKKQLLQDLVYNNQVVLALQSREVKVVVYEPPKDYYQAIELKIQRQVERRDQLSCWGLIDQVVSYQNKCRLMETLISQAQSQKRRPGSQVAQDLSEWIGQRTQARRNFDKYTRVYDKVVSDKQQAESINALVIKFVTKQRGNDQWLKITNLKQLRVSKEIVEAQPSNWELTIKREKTLDLSKASVGNQSKMERLKKLFDSDSEYEDQIDRMAAEQGALQFLDKVDRHLAAESALITN